MIMTTILWHLQVLEFTWGRDLFSGDGSTTLYTYNIDLSDPDYAGGPVVGVGTTQLYNFCIQKW